MCLLNKTEISGFLGSSPKGDEVLYNTGSSCPFVHLSVCPFVHLFVPLPLPGLNLAQGGLIHAIRCSI